MRPLQLIDAFTQAGTPAFNANADDRSGVIVLIADTTEGHRVHLEVIGFQPSVICLGEIVPDIIEAHPKVSIKKETFSNLVGYSDVPRHGLRVSAPVSEIRTVQRALETAGAETYRQLPPEKELLLVRGLNFGEWFTFERAHLMRAKRGMNPPTAGTLVYYGSCAAHSLRPLPHFEGAANSGTMYFDIETNNVMTREFSDASRGDEVECVAVVMRGGPWDNRTMMITRGGEQWRGHRLRRLNALGGPMPEVINCASERDLLTLFARVIAMELRPTRIVAHNGNGFDWPFLMQASARLRIPHFEQRLSPFALKPKTRALSSYEHRVMLAGRDIGEINVRGIVFLDSCLYADRTFKLSSYSLNSVAAHVLGEDVQKDEMPAETMLRAFRREGKPCEVGPHGEALRLVRGLLPDDVWPTVERLLGEEADARFRWQRETMRDVMNYCARDVEVMVLVCEKIDMNAAVCSFASVTNVPEQKYVYSGEQEKGFSLISRHAYAHNILINKRDLPPVVDGESYQGATVLEAQTGIYTTPVIGVDFASLYPSIMIAWNLSYDTLYLVNGQFGKPAQRDAHKFHPFTHSDGSVVYFARATEKFGVLPTIVRDLLSKRKATKADMKRETDPFKKMLLDKKQGALKVTANALYGFTGAQKGRLPCAIIARTITLQGRHLIDITKSHIEAHPVWNCKVVYGDTDSCMVLPLSPMSKEEAWDLGEVIADECNSKLYPKPVNLEMEKIMLPFLLKKKKMYVTMAYESREGAGKRVAMGVDIARRDNPKFHRAIYSKVVDQILQELPVSLDNIIAGVHRVMRCEIQKLVDDQIDVRDYVVTKSIKQDNQYAMWTGDDASIKIPQVQAAKRFASRIKAGLIAAEPPRAGDRVPYVVVVTGDARAKRTEQAEHVDWVIHNGEIPDRGVYARAWTESIQSLLEPARIDKVHLTRTLCDVSKQRHSLWTVPYGADGLSLSQLHELWCAEIDRQIKKAQASRQPLIAKKRGNRLLDEWIVKKSQKK
tara:strand:- start:7867 stop:10881 length:3015 start_codon:yes stop_codon:yes gene_type:complete